MCIIRTDQKITNQQIGSSSCSTNPKTNFKKTEKKRKELNVYALSWQLTQMILEIDFKDLYYVTFSTGLKQLNC